MKTNAPHILIVDDDIRLQRLLHKFLGDAGFLVSTAGNAADARTKLAALTFDLMILDVMMPGETGLALAAGLRRDNHIPILMLTAMGQPEDRIIGLETGVDDYLPKPFEPRELLLRINNILRRSTHLVSTVPMTSVTLGKVLFNPMHSTLVRNGKTIRLTSLEAELLRILATKPGEILSREELTKLSGAIGSERSVDVQITRLRKKIEDDPRMPRYLQTVRGRGYILRPD